MALDPNEEGSEPIAKFESMLKTDDVYFFDAEDFEDIIHHYLNNGKVSLAKKAIKIGLEQHPETTPLKLLEIEVMVFENKLDLAITQLDYLESLDQKNEEIFIQRANIWSKQDKHLQAISCLEKALLLTEDTLDIYALLGMEYLFLEDFEKAKHNFIKCVEEDPQDYASLYNIIYCFEYLEDPDGAISYLNDYLEKEPYCEVAWHQLGKQYKSKGLYKEALTAFDFAIISDESFIGAYFEKAMVLEKLKRYNEAIENYETTIDLEDPTAHAYLRIGRCHEKIGNSDLAQQYYYKTVHEDPLLDKGWLAITNFYIKEKNYEKALYYINKALHIDTENEVYWKKCAQINVSLGQLDEADFAYKQAVEFGDYDLSTWESWALVVMENKEFEAANQILLQAIGFFPEIASLRYRLAFIFGLSQDIEQSKYHLSEALRLDYNLLAHFKSQYPGFFNSTWVSNFISTSSKASS